MLSCKDISELASQHLDKELPLMQRLQFRLHLFMCENCRQFVQQMNVTIQTISKITPIKPDDRTIDTQVSQLMKIMNNSTQNSS